MLDRRWVRWVVWTIAALAGLLVIGVALLHLPQTRQYALRRAAGMLRGQGIDFDASHFRFNLLKFSATLNNVVVRSPAARNLPPFLEVDQLQIDFSLRKLIQGAYHLEDAVIRNPRINLVIDQSGRDNIPRPPQIDKPKPHVDYLIDRLVISGGRLRYEDRRQQIITELPLRELTIDGNPLTGNHEILLSSSPGGQLQFQNRSLPITSVAGAAHMSKDALDVRRLELVLGDSTIVLSGTLKSFDDPNFDVKAETTLTLGSLVEFANVPQKVRGNILVSLTANGPIGRLKARARVEGRDLSVDRFELLSLKAEAAYDAEASRVRLESLNVISASGTVRGEASVALTASAGRSTANIGVRAIDLAQISRTLRLPVLVASRATADITANWPALEFEKTTGDATVRLAATRSVPVAQTLPVSGAFSARARGETLVVDIASLRALDVITSGRLSVRDRRALAGQLRLEVPDLSSTIAAAEVYLGKQPGTLAGTPIQGAATVTASLEGTIQTPRVDASLAAENLQAGTLDGIDLNLGVNYTPTRMAVDNLNLRWREQSLTASGTIGLTGREPALDLRAATEGVTIESVLSGLNRTDLPVSGKVELNAEIKGTTKSPQGDFHLAASDLFAYNEPLGTLSVDARLQDQVAHLTELSLRKPQPQGEGTLRMTGTYDLNDREYSAQAESKNLRLNSLTLPGAIPVRAELQLQAKGQGTIDNPGLDLHLKADQVEIRERPLGTVELSSKVANQKSESSLKAPKFGITATAGIGTQTPHPADFVVQADNTNLKDLPIEVDPSLTGTVTATVRGKGDIDNFRKGEASVEVASLNIDWRGQPIRAEQPLRFRYHDQLLSIDQATIVARESRISLKGELPLDPAGTGAIELAAKLDLPSLALYIPSDQPIEAKGQVTIDGAIRGNLKRIDPNISVALTGGYFLMPGQKFPVSEIDLVTTIANGALELQRASARFGPASFTASGTVPFGLLPAGLPVELPRRQGAAQVTAELKSLDLAALPNKPERLAGTLSARLDVQAPRPDLQAVTGTLSFPDLRVNVGTYGLEQKGISEVVFENGTARIAKFDLTGPETEIRLAGTAGLAGERPLDLRVDGKLDASIASAFTDAVRMSGATGIQAAITGTAQQPQARGHLQMTDGQLFMDQPRIGAEQLNLRLELEGQRLTLAHLEGTINGGALSGGGGMEFAGGELRNADLNLKADDVYMDYPQGLKTVSNIALSLQNKTNEIVLGGNVSILEGGFTDDLHFDRGILAAVTAPRGVELTEERNRMLEKVRLSIGVRTEEPIVIDNNLAKSEITADLRVVGTPYEPGLTGRLEIAEDGELRLQERRYVVERGVITFTNERRIEPSMDIVANTSAQGYDIRLEVSGEPGKTETRLTSDPELPEPDIMSLLITGRKMDDLRGEEFAVASNQALSYLTGRVGSQLGRGLEKATGLSTVRIEPNLIAAEADPGARLTMGQNITRNLELIYSMDLMNSSDQIYVAEYDLSKRFSTRGVRESDGSYRFDFKHDLRFGGIPEPRRGVKHGTLKIGQVSFTGKTYFPEKQIAKKLRVEAGDRYDFFKVRKGLDRLNKLYTREGLVESNVRLKREQHNSALDLNLDIKPGPKLNFVFEGIGVPGKVRGRVRDVWRGGVFDSQRAEDSQLAIREWLVRDRYLQSSLKYSIVKPDEDSKRVVFDIQPGPRFAGVKIEFDGASKIESGKLRDVIDDQKMSTDVYTKPGRVTELLTRFYHEMGYLDAQVSNPKYDLDPHAETGRVVFPLSEGPLYRVGKVEFDGNTVFTDARLAEAVPLPVGENYRPVLREHALQRLKDLYWEQGYNDVDAEFVLSRNREAATVDIAFRITENRKSITRDVVVEGNDKTSENMILSQLEVRPGDPVSLQKLGNSRRNLYRTGAYSLIDILREPAEGSGGADAETPVRLRVKVREVQPFLFRYGAYFDTERGPGAIVDFSNRNSLGSARVLGFRGQYDSQLREGRVYFSQPTLRRFPLKTIVNPYLRYERNPASDEVDAFNVDRVGFSLQQELALRKDYIFTYGYRIEQSRTYDPVPDPIFDITLRVAALTSTLTRESRDEILDATRGGFLSHAIEFSPSALGSEVRFIKYFGQYFRYFPLQKPRIELFTNEVLRPRLVYAAGVRVGLATGLGGQEVPLSERFFAGGSNTIRGFAQNSVGPIVADGVPRGGQAMLVINNEIRFPLIGIFDGVGFVDVGNVYPAVTDFSLTDIRKAAGIGLRVRTPWFLIRLDYGVKLDRRPGESRGRLFLSFGQAF